VEVLPGAVWAMACEQMILALLYAEKNDRKWGGAPSGFSELRWMEPSALKGNNVFQLLVSPGRAARQ